MLAREHGVKIAISIDAHAEGQLGFVRFGINQARRGRLSADDVIDTRDLAGLRRPIQ